MNKQKSTEDDQSKTMNCCLSQNLMPDIVDIGGRLAGRSAAAGSFAGDITSRPDMGGETGFELAFSDKNLLSVSLGDLSFASFDGGLSPEDLAVFQSFEERHMLEDKLGVDSPSDSNGDTKPPGRISDIQGMNTRGSVQKTDWNALYRTAVSQTSGVVLTSNDRRDDNSAALPSAWKPGSDILSGKDGDITTSSSAYAVGNREWTQSREALGRSTMSSGHDMYGPVESVSSAAQATECRYENEIRFHPFGDIFSSKSSILQIDGQHLVGPSPQNNRTEEGKRKRNFHQFVFDMSQALDTQDQLCAENHKKQVVCESIELHPASDSNPTDHDSSASHKRSRKHEPDVRMYVDEITEFDVLMGRGGRSNRHIGNHFYLKVVEETKGRYEKCKKKFEKTEVAQSVVDFINQKRKGRFLQLDEDSDQWYIADNRAARTKAGQALRDQNTPEARAEKRKKYGC